MNIKKTKIPILIIALIIVLLCFVPLHSYLKSNKTVGHISENKIHYKNQIYTENFEVFEFEIGKCLGTVECEETGSRMKIYALKGRPEYLYLSMTTDYRIYKLKNQ